MRFAIIACRASITGAITTITFLALITIAFTFTADMIITTIAFMNAFNANMIATFIARVSSGVTAIIFTIRALTRASVIAIRDNQFIISHCSFLSIFLIAFNSIHYTILKSSSACREHVKPHICEIMNRYFREI